MTKSTWIAVSAGALGQGRAEARRFGDLAVRAAAQPPFAVRRGSGLLTTRLRYVGHGPVGGTTPTGIAPTGIAPTGIAPTGIAPTGIAPTGIAPTGNACTPGGEFVAQHDGTTLGFHTSSRPLS